MSRKVTLNTLGFKGLTTPWGGGERDKRQKNDLRENVCYNLFIDTLYL